ncbi:dihydrolipoamide acetyltransferase [Marinomonas sp. SBI22]|uniref:2-oxo acid dehydrogenase subunit E2 n=1 Tax=unclassified Marinomonas TaxID=196814 RepID=UPI0007AF19F0|nr:MULTISPECIES: 2-oxo acid dehydrogenase subunit E2 [unclassified Marinomonas]KZM44939.1 dihydrolipoamide acetyltransferase [Marinomonas sp. SBI22]KZM46638.1 dihydrolipoamide acetyltransferase [Marinomonas sp. SBI8L]
MKIDFILPDIGEGIVECELVDWHISEGMAVTEDQSVADVMTDKALVEITSMYTGTISKLYYAKGEIAKVHQPLFEIEVADDESTSVETNEQVVEAPAMVANSDINTLEPQTVPDSETQISALANTGKAIASPAVRRLARENNIEISQVVGSGKNGRVMKQDLFNNMQEPAQLDNPQTLSTVPDSKTNRTEAIKGVKAVMAKQMMESVSTIPHFTYAEEIDVTKLDSLRQELKASFADQGAKLSMMPFLMKALALSLPHFPELNSRVNESCTEITYLNAVNIGMAADTPLGLLVPNVKNVESLSLFEVCQEVNRLADMARQGKLKNNEMKGGTITISNIGVIGGTVATPIISKPEVAIVALGKIQTLPRFNEKGEVEARKIMQISWSGDHRVIDGATMARFCNHWKAYLENPVTMLSHLR